MDTYSTVVQLQQSLIFVVDQHRIPVLRKYIAYPYHAVHARDQKQAYVGEETTQMFSINSALVSVRGIGVQRIQIPSFLFEQQQCERVRGSQLARFLKDEDHLPFLLGLCSSLWSFWWVRWRRVEEGVLQGKLPSC